MDEVQSEIESTHDYSLLVDSIERNEIHFHVSYLRHLANKEQTHWCVHSRSTYER